MKITAKRTVSLLAAAALGSVSLLALAQPAKMMLERMDEDGDGRISEAEFSPWRDRPMPMLERGDADGDGKVSREEAQAMMEQRQAERQQQAQERMDAMFSELDANEDGMIDAEEARGRRFQRLDTNGDGFLDAEELESIMDRRGHRMNPDEGRGHGDRGHGHRGHKSKGGAESSQGSAVDEGMGDRR